MAKLTTFTIKFRGTGDLQTLYFQYIYKNSTRCVRLPMKGKKEHFNQKTKRFDLRGNFDQELKKMYSEMYNPFLERFGGLFAEFAMKMTADKDMTVDELKAWEESIISDGSAAFSGDTVSPRKEREEKAAYEKVSDLLCLLDRMKEDRAKASTLKLYKRQSSQLVEWMAAKGIDSLRNWREETITEWLEERSRRLCSETIAHNLIVVKQLNKALWKFKKIGKDAFDGIDRMKFVMKRTRKEEKVYLKPEEIRLIWEADLTGMSESARKARDLFVFQCLSGQRYSDTVGLDAKGNGCILDLEKKELTLTQRKTGEMATIPLSATLMAILERWSFRLPWMPCSSYNDCIKSVARNVGGPFDEVVGFRKGRKMYKWDMISSHTGRRSFITNALKKGIPAHIIQGVSGHRNTVLILSTYNKMTLSDKSSIFRDMNGDDF